MRAARQVGVAVRYNNHAHMGASMAQGVRGKELTEWEKEKIRQAFAESGNIAHAARQANVQYTTARAYCNSHWHELSELRAQVKEDIVRDIALFRRLVLEELMSPKRIAAASTGELMSMLNQSNSQIYHLQGGPSARIEVTHGQRTQEFHANALTPEDRERAREVQRKLMAGKKMASLEERSIIDVAGSVS